MLNELNKPVHCVKCKKILLKIENEEAPVDITIRCLCGLSSRITTERTFVIKNKPLGAIK